MDHESFHGIYGTIWIILLANMIHFYSVPFSTATTALKRLTESLKPSPSPWEYLLQNAVEGDDSDVFSGHL